MRLISVICLFGTILVWLQCSLSAPAPNYEKEIDTISNIARELEEAVKNLEEKINVETKGTLTERLSGHKSTGDDADEDGRVVDGNDEDLSKKTENKIAERKANEANSDSEKALDTVDQEKLLEELLGLLEERRNRRIHG